MQTRSRNTFTSIHTEGSLLPGELAQRILSGDKDVGRLAKRTRLGEKNSPWRKELALAKRTRLGEKNSPWRKELALAKRVRLGKKCSPWTCTYGGFEVWRFGYPAVGCPKRSAGFFFRQCGLQNHKFML
jgi:hypothetical protein